MCTQEKQAQSFLKQAEKIYQFYRRYHVLSKPISAFCIL